MAKLTPKQQRFVDEYLIDLNAKQAAIRSGYSPKTAEQQGFQLLKKTSVSEAIEQAQKERQKRTLVTQDDVIRGLLTEAEWQGEGSSHSARVSSWAHLGKHLNMFTDKIDHTSSDSSMSPNLKIEFINASNTGVGQV